MLNKQEFGDFVPEGDRVPVKRDEKGIKNIQKLCTKPQDCHSDLS